MALLLKHQTKEQFIARLREEYRNSEGERTIQLGKFIVAKLGTNDFSDIEMRAAFGLTTAQWNTLKTKLNARVTASNTVRTALGE